jgi:ABC-type branched-subunit amino acid transport system ATPase component
MAADRPNWGDPRRPAPPGRPGTGMRQPMGEALVVRNLSKRFGGLRAVQAVDFTVGENEIVALIGPNGAGKTTTFNLITGNLKPDTGSVSAFGREMVGLRPHAICAHGLARTFQVAKPFGAMSVLANVMIGAFLRDKSLKGARAASLEAVEFVGLRRAPLRWWSKLVLKLSGVGTSYGSVPAVSDVSIAVADGEAVGLLGANGAGKSTTLRVISGLLRPTAGTITFLGRDLASLPAHRIPELGIAHVPEGRQVFPEMTVEENLEIGAYVPKAKAER